ncbi:MAG: class I SAM-dependent methyltransferase [Candidatus Liptonbacteria bacterium]
MNETQQCITRSTCRVCGASNLTPIWSLGELYVSDFLGPGEESAARKFPLELMLCNAKNGGCGLLQLKHTVSAETLYRNYWYRSGMNKTMTDELQGIARTAESLVNLEPGDFVMDIAANDGTLLRGYTTSGINLTGYEPAKNLAQYNPVSTRRIFQDFFDAEPWKKEFGDQKAKIITAIAMFYDLEDPNKFVSDVAELLDPEGIFIVQMMSLPLMLKQNAFDNICHEHLEYYSLLAMENLLRRHNLEVFDVALNDINGGSFRLYMRHARKGKTVKVPPEAEGRVKALREHEAELGLNDQPVYDKFAAEVEKMKEQAQDFIKKEVTGGKKVYVYGASTKGNTLLQYYGLDNKLITAAAERNPDKWGKKTVGTMIPIISEDQARKEKPDYFLVLPWHFIKEFKERERDYLQGGGKFIIPLPQFGIVDQFLA